MPDDLERLRDPCSATAATCSSSRSATTCRPHTRGSDRRDALAELHREFCARAPTLQTMTFYASDDKLATVGLAGRVDEIDRDAVRIAREVAAEGDALVAGNLSFTWSYDPADASSADRVRALFDRQLQDQVDAGPPDFWIGETFSYLGEALLFVERAKEDRRCRRRRRCGSRPPAPRSYEGDTPGNCARRLRDAGADVGVNCLNGPDRRPLQSRWSCARPSTGSSPPRTHPTGRAPSGPKLHRAPELPLRARPFSSRAWRWRPSRDAPAR